MTHRLEKHKAPTSASAAASSVKSNQALVSAVKPRKWDEQAELEQANALYSLLENRYAKQFLLSGRLRAPASNPTYYDDLITEMQEAPHRSWFGAIMKRIKGSMRFS
jgi:cytochrome b pre-mRNA-processing protein 6